MRVIPLHRTKKKILKMNLHKYSKTIMKNLKKIIEAKIYF